MTRKATVPADQEDRVTKVEEGELVDMTLSEPAKLAVQPKCDLKAGRWYCATHRKGFDNQFQKDTHIDTGKHRMAWVCFEHGLEVP